MSAVARRYSEALFLIAKDNDAVLEYQDSVIITNQILQSDPLFPKVFASPKISKKEKIDILKRTFNQQIPAMVLNFLYVLINKGRFSELNSITDLFIETTDDYLGIVKGTVYSVRPLANTEIEMIEQSFSTKLNKQVQLKNIIDESLLSGAKIVIGDVTYDGSMRKKVDDLRSQLLSKEGE